MDGSGHREGPDAERPPVIRVATQDGRPQSLALRAVLFCGFSREAGPTRLGGRLIAAVVARVHQREVAEGAVPLRRIERQIVLPVYRRAKRGRHQRPVAWETDKARENSQGDGEAGRREIKPHQSSCLPASLFNISLKCRRNEGSVRSCSIPVLRVVIPLLVGSNGRCGVACPPVSAIHDAPRRTGGRPLKTSSFTEIRPAWITRGSRRVSCGHGLWRSLAGLGPPARRRSQ